MRTEILITPLVDFTSSLRRGTKAYHYAVDRAEWMLTKKGPEPHWRVLAYRLGDRCGRGIDYTLNFIFQHPERRIQ